MAMIADAVLDNGLNYAKSKATRLVMCSAEPSNFAGVAAVTLGTATPSISGPSERAGGGRKITVASVSDSSVTNEGTPTHWALVNDDDNELLVTQTGGGQILYEGNTWSLAAPVDIEMPGAQG